MKTTEPTSRTGVYERPQDIPPHRRISNESPKQSPTDVWKAYLGKWPPDGNRPQWAIECWFDFCDEQACHPAYAEPTDAIAFSSFLREEYALSTIRNYWGETYKVYNWLCYHTEYPHRYNSFLLAAVNDTDARYCFDCYVER